MKAYIYQYKIQWLFNTNKGDLKNCYNVIKAVGAKALTVINFRDERTKIIANYTGMVQYPFGLSESETIKEIKRKLKSNPKIKTVELLRR